jgi:hypothetical protein
MTPQVAGKCKAINLDNVTFVEQAQWHFDGDPHKTLVKGVIVHFVGGSAVRLLACEAAEILAQFGLA